MSSLVLWVVLSPLIGSLLLGALYLSHIKITKIKERYFTMIAIFTPFVSFVFSLMLFLYMTVKNQTKISYIAFKWLKIGDFDVNIAFLADRLSIFMILFITFIGWMIHIYAVGYMKGDKGYGKFFAYFNLFLGMMLVLVLADNPVFMFFGWEGVGLCSYLLIGFYYKDADNVKAANKAFIANRIGDFGFVSGLSLLFLYIGKYGFDFLSLGSHIDKVPTLMLPLIAFLLFVGAMGKSAQIPLYVWLPDAMAGPTPVSALIHAATMVTAGVYMVSRFHFLYELTPNVGEFIAFIGAASSLFAALIAMKQRDIKKILAYSTISQLGYMFVAVGLGFYSAGLFHVFTHAFFKALLFMGAGAVILQLHHEQDIFKMGDMKNGSKTVYYTFLVATLAICGIFPFSGFFSKDEILLGAFESGHYALWAVELFTAGLTAYYMFRLFFTVFISKKSDKRVNRCEKLSKFVLYPLVVLAIGSATAGFVGIGENGFVQKWLSYLGENGYEVSFTTQMYLIVLNTAVVLTGIGTAYLKFVKTDAKNQGELRGVIYNKFYIDEIYDRVFIKNLQRLSLFISQNIDKRFIDGGVMAAAKYFYRFSELISVSQNGNVRTYAFYMLLGVSVFFTYLLYVAG